jgi:predicted amidohydrolase
VKLRIEEKRRELHKDMKITVSTCQFSTSSNIQENYEQISQLIEKSKVFGADIAHFPETCLSGYAGFDISNTNNLDWKLLKECTYEIMNIAKEKHIWVILGSTHKLTGKHKPHNSLYIINNNGQLKDRYDKRFCSGDSLEMNGDLEYYSPGNHFSVFNLNGIVCGTLICHDYRYPELARKYKKMGVQVLFHSFHASNFSSEKIKSIEEQIGLEYLKYNHGTTYPSITMPASMIATAAYNHIWISCPNSSAKESLWGSFFVRADGIVTGQLEKDINDVLISTVDTEEDLYDSTKAWRTRSMSGIYHSGTLVRNTKSLNRKEL